MARIIHHKKNNTTRWIIGGLIFALFLAITSIFLILYPFASRVKEAYFKGEYPILFNGNQMGNALIDGKTLYVPLKFMKENIDSQLFYDEKSKSVIITTKDKVIQMPAESLTYFVNQKPVKLQISPILSKEGQVFIALDSILPFYPIQYEKLKDSGAIWIQRNGDSFRSGSIASGDENPEKLRLRVKPEWQSPYTAETKKHETVHIEDEKKDFYFVRKENGIGGYIRKEFVKPSQQVKIVVNRQQEKIHKPALKAPIQLTWEAVYSRNPDFESIPPMPGINVVSPTWFSLTGADGTIKNLASLEYSKLAKKKGYHVWALFSNGFDPELTHDALKDYETRQKIIVQLLHFTQMYQLEGINFDIENVNPEDGPLVTQLMREATPYLHEAGQTVSMDITFAAENSNWSTFYERKKLAQIADYLIVMAYDEHWGKTSGSGSVASLPWVESNLKNLLAEVPNERLILGVPLFARLWKEVIQEDGSTEITTKAFSMEKVKEWLAEHSLTPVYNPDSGQNYAEYYSPDEKATYRIWIEDGTSLSKRANLVNTYKLAGIASWSRYFADQSAWTALQLNPKKEISKK